MPRRLLRPSGKGCFKWGKERRADTTPQPWWGALPFQKTDSHPLPLFPRGTEAEPRSGWTGRAWTGVVAPSWFELGCLRSRSEPCPPDHPAPHSEPGALEPHVLPGTGSTRVSLSC